MWFAQVTCIWYILPSEELDRTAIPKPNNSWVKIVRCHLVRYNRASGVIRNSSVSLRNTPDTQGIQPRILQSWDFLLDRPPTVAFAKCERLYKAEPEKHSNAGYRNAEWLDIDCGRKKVWLSLALAIPSHMQCFAASFAASDKVWLEWRTQEKYVSA